MHTSPTEIFLWRELAIFLRIGALLGVALGLLLIFTPHLLGRINRVANPWISMHHVSRWLERSIRIERWFYRHHRPLGILVILGAGYILVYFGLLFDKAYALQRLSSTVPANLLEVLLDALVLALLLGATAALVAGFFIWLRPSLLRGVEEGSNQWVSSCRAAKMLDAPHGQVDSFIARHAQKVGWLLLLGSIYLFFVLFLWLV